MRDFMTLTHRASEVREDRTRELMFKAMEICLVRLQSVADISDRNPIQAQQVVEISLQPMHDVPVPREDYMRDHYEETTASPAWLALPDEEKRRMLDSELDEWWRSRRRTH